MTVMTPPTTGFPVPLTNKARTIACERIRPQLDAERQYRAGLARYAVEFYLHCMAFDLDPDARESADPITSQLLETADVAIKNLGKLECCAVAPGAEVVQVPADAWSDRLAYAVVKIDARGRQAEILGFSAEAPAGGCIPLKRLQPIDELPQYLHDCKTTVISPIWAWAQVQEQQLNALTESLCATFRNWQLRSPEPSFAYRWRSERTLPSPGLDEPMLVTKTISLQNLALELVLGIRLKGDGRWGIGLSLEEKDRFLPAGLRLTVIDEDERVFQELTAAGNDPFLVTRPFTAAPGEAFTIALSYGTDEHTEAFVTSLAS